MATASPPLARPNTAQLFPLRTSALARAIAVLVSLALLAAFLVKAPLAICLALVGGSVGCLALVLRPVLGLYALAFAIPFGSLCEVTYGGLTLGLGEALVVFSLGAWLMRMAALRRVRLAGSRLVLAMLVFIGALVVSFWHAQSTVPALKELAKWLEFLGVYLLTASDLGRAEMDTLVGALLIAGILQGALGIYQFLFRVGPPGFGILGRYMRAHGTFRQPNPYGGYLGLLLPLGYTTVIVRWRELPGAWRARNWRRVMMWPMGAVATLVMGVAMLMSMSRGALVGVVMGATLVGAALGRKARQFALAALLIAALLGPQLLSLLPQDYVGRITDSLGYVGMRDLSIIEITDENFAAVERAAHWVAAWRMFEQRPWLGVGTGQYAVVYPDVALPRWPDPLGHAHNYYLNILAEGGLVGLSAYLIFLLTAFWSAWRQALPGSDTAPRPMWQRGLGLAALGALAHLATHSLLDNLYVHAMYLLVALLLGMAASVGNDAPWHTMEPGAPSALHTPCKTP